MSIDSSLTVAERLALVRLAKAAGLARSSAQLRAIERVDRSGRLPLSYAQQRLWFLEQMGELGSAYHVGQRLRLRGALDREALVRALDRLVARHEVLRTTFRSVGGEPEQRIAPETSRFHLVEHDLAGEAGALEALGRVIAEESTAPFDLERGPPIRGRLVRLAADDHVLLLTMHHIVADGWSMGVLTRELGVLYAAFHAGLPDPLPALPIQYADYAAWQRRWVQDEVLEAQASYWTNTLAGAPALLELPTDHPRPQRQDHAGAALWVELGAELTQGLRALGRRHGTTAFMTLLAGWAAVLGRLSGQEEVVIGMPTANRGRPEIEGLIGFFVNTLALRVDLSERPTVAGLLEQVKRRALEAQQNQDIPFEQVVERVDPVRTLAHTPLFQVLFAWQNAPGGGFELPGLSLEDVARSEQTTSKFDLSLSLAERDGRIEGVMEHATSLFERATVERHLGYLRRVLEQMVADDAQAVDRLALLSEAERHQVVEAWNRTEAEVPRDACIHALFEAQVARTPGAVAAVHEDESLTYAELNARANRLARRLRARGVRPGARVAVLVPRSIELVVAELAVLKAGAAYVPIDPGFPSERIAWMVADSGSAFALHPDQDAEDALAWLPGVEGIGVGASDEGTAENLGITLPGDAVAYVMYTSGSTGTPKGVMAPHRAIARLVLNNGFAAFGPDDRVAFASNPTFDASTLELWAPLLNGGRVVVVPQEVLLEPRRFGQALTRHGVDVLWLTVGLFNQYADELKEELGRLRYLVVGGDALDAGVIARVLRGGHAPEHLINGYGPTETTTFALTHEIGPEAEGARSIPLGQPIGNTQVYVLDGRGEPVPVGVAGELYIGGTGVAHGYLNRPALTAERFVPDAFGGEAGARLYRTGDLGRWLPDGTIEFLGRNDFQVKVRGFRIELGEIEARLAEHPSVREAVVLAREDAPGDRRLVAYYLADEPVDVEALRRHVGERLPEYMVPAAYVRLKALPLTSNGKLDRGALPAPEGDAFATRGYEAPVGETEQALAEIWSEVLGVERVGRWDHFFELGGHSLLVVRVVSRIRQVLGAEAELGVVFERPVLRELAEVVAAAGRVELPAIERVDRGAPLPLSFAQQRLWFLEQLGELGSTYHIPHRLRMRGALDREALVRALDRLVARHEVLRTTFSVQGGEPEQRIGPETSRFQLVEHDLAGEAGALEALERVMAEEGSAPFDLERGPLIRGQLIRLDADDHVLLLTMHHIVSDGWSVGVLVDELGRLYAAFRAGGADPLPALPIQYADYAAWQRRWVEDRVLEAQAGYWTKTLAGASQLLELPMDHPRPQRQDHAGAALRVELDAELTQGLRALGRRRGTTLFMTLLAGWAAVLGRLSGQEDVVVGTPTANRGRREIEGLIGFFVNTLALRVDLSGSPTVAELLEQVRARSLEAQQNQDIPFEQVVERVQPVRSLAHAPLFQVMFAWLDASEGRLELPGLRLGGVGSASQVTAKFDLSFSLGEADGRIVGSVEYATALFEQATVERHLAYLRRVLEAFVADDLQGVDALPLLPEAERRLVVEAWNATDAAQPSELCIHARFEAQARLAPDAVALVHADEALSYAELNRRANRLAHYLRALGVGPDARVAICAGRTPELVVGLLAILKAGGAYVPLDPGYPEERLRYLLADSAPVLVLTQGALRKRFAAMRVPVVALDDDAPAWAREPELDPARADLTPGHLAYVIYTSGSTGAPKGVMVAHRSVGRQVAAIQAGFGLRADDRGLQFASVTFDASVEEIFGALLSGAALVLRGEEWLEDARTFWGACARHRVTVIDLPTRFWQLLLDEPSAAIPACVRLLAIGGEAVEPAALEAWFLRGGHRPRLLNGYGPTEATVNATLREVTGDPATWRSIGRPVANTRAYPLDARGRPVPVGVAGELYLGGGQVARGYLGRPGVTAERFVPDPFGDAGARLYRTGDRVRWSADGTLEYLGRADFQVKVRGFRIEPGEIEARLREHEGVREAVVVVREDVPGERRLVAYYAGEAWEAEALRAHLSERLPEYMVPAAYVRLEAFPLTPSGKVDRKALPAPEGDAFARRGYEAPVGEVEEALAEIWSELLGVERVGRWDHFFELGGHSLLIVKLIERMRRRGLHAEVGTLFTTPVLAQLAEVVGGEALEVAVPANAIPPESEAITPGMLPLVTLGQADIDGIVAGVEGGAGNVQDIYPLAPLQEGILFHHLLQQEGDPYLVPSLLEFERRDQLDAYLGALQAVIDRHDILRTAVVWESLPEPVQVVWRRARLPVVEVELDPAEGDAARALWNRFDPQRTRLDVRRAPVMRCCVARDAANDRWLLLLQDHHLISDHTTLEVLQEEVRAHLRGRQAELPAPLPFRNYVARTRLGVSRAEHEAFFRALLGDVEAPTAPFGLLDVWGDGSGVESAREWVAPELAARLRARARALGVSAATVCHVAWGQVLARTTGRDDVVFGTVLLGRMLGGQGTDRAMGLFMNTLPVRVRVGAEGAEASVRGMHRQLAELLRHEHASLALARRSSGVEAPAPLFTSLLNYRHNPGGSAAPSPAAPGASGGMRSLRAEERTNYPITFSIDDCGDEVQLSVQVPASVGAARVVAMMRTALEALLETLERAPGRAVGTIDVLPEAERRTVVEAWNRTDAPHAGESCIHARFEAQVARTPNAAAVVFAGEPLGYAELNRRANRLAHHLGEMGVGPDVRVGVCVERGPEMVVGLLAVLKAGGAYVPLDPTHPGDRLRTMLEDSRPAALLTSEALRGSPPLDALFREAGVPVLALDADAPSWAGRPETNPAPAGLTPDHLAYVIYTSGSTGRPKGVMNHHRGVVNLLLSLGRTLSAGEGDRLLAVTTLSFDIAALEIYLPLLSGAELHLLPDAAGADPALLAETIDAAGVTLLQATPATWRLLVDSGWRGRGELRALCGGEALPAELAARVAERVGALWNVYGPTETTIWSTVEEVTPASLETPGHLSIGRPVANTRVYVLDAAGEPAPVGVAGELYVGGDGVARGYRGRPGLTAERFVADPFSARPGARLYRTGDLARWRGDGRLEFLGRTDFQVKVRGFRIELGEIEARLAEHPGVRETVVLAREGADGSRQLVAWYVGAEGAGALEAAALRAHLSSRLPEYMVPAAYVHLEAMPLTPNGKVDRKALPSPEGGAYARRGYEAPVGEVETALAEIWAEVLELERVGRHDHFFELGGHSLLAVRLTERMRQRGLHVEVRVLFATPTLWELALAVSHESSAVRVPPSAIPPGCEAITPGMLPLVALGQDEIDRIVAGVPGGAANVQDIYPLAPLQEGIFFHHLMAEGHDPYLNAQLLSFDTRPRLDAYLAALQAVVDRHDVLRTSVAWEGLREPAQVVWRRAMLPVEEVALDAAGGDAAGQLWARFDPRNGRMDIGQAPMMRLFVAADPQQGRWVLLWWYYHLIQDHATIEALLSEVEAHLQGRAHELPPAQPYRNYVAQARLGVSREEHERFFRALLGDVEEPTVPFGVLDARADGTGVTQARLDVDAALSRRLRARAQGLGVSAASVFHLAWAQVLARVSGRDDVVFGTLLFGRAGSGAGAEGVMGMLINTLPVRLRVGDEGAEVGVRRTHAQLAELLRHEHASLALAQRCSGVAAPAPLFTSLLNYRHDGRGGETRRAHPEEAPQAMAGIGAIFGQERTNYPVTLSVDDLGDGFVLSSQGVATIDPQRVCAFMHRALERLVDALEAAPATALRALDVLPEAERRLVVEEWNRTEAPYPSALCIHGLVETQAERTPDAVALVFEDESLSYAELNRWANRLAHHLRERGVGPDVRVAIHVDRTPETLVGILAVLKAGGAYVPLDPGHPEERLRYMLRDSAPVLLLAPGGAPAWVPAGLPVMDLSEREPAWAAGPDTDPDADAVGVTPADLAYVIYTSGSTGTPKGVLVPHRGVVSMTAHQRRFFGVRADERVLQIASFGFDASLWDVTAALAHGGTLCLASGDAALPGPALLRYLAEQRVTFATLQPTTLAVLDQEALPELRTLIAMGDACTAEVVARWAPGRHFYNGYGPTEATIAATVGESVAGGGKPTIGRPFTNLRVYVLDRRGRPVPVGVEGELHVGGAGVVRGYLDRPLLTAEQFVPDPFGGEPGARLYRTGDRGRWLPTGELEFLGRVDAQVKIRGYRVEPGEVEARLAEHEGVREAAVVVREDAPGEKQLVAYFVATDGGVTAESLRDRLLERLPAYMVPAAFVRLEALPLTPNAKLDRKALPAPQDEAYARRGYEAPVGEVEQALAEIWGEVLGVERVGRRDDFFELGGHSLLVVRVVSRIRQVLGAEVELGVVFQRPVLKELAEALAAAGRAELPAIERADRSARLPLSYAQQRLWFLERMGDLGSTYHLPGRLRLRGELDREALGRALDRLVARHESLRTTFAMVNGEPEQRIAPETSRFHLVEHDLAGEAGASEALQRVMDEEAAAPFDLERGPLIRSRLVRLAEDDHVLLLTMHHIVSDGWSMGVFIDELGRLYGAFREGRADPLPPLPIQYADYAAWQRRWVEDEVLEAQRGYWTKTLAGAPELLELPADRPRPRRQDHLGASVQVVLDEALAAGLKELSRRHGTTLFMTLLAGWATVLGRLARQEEVVMGTTTANRGRAEIEGLIGFFVNTLALRIDLSGRPSVAEVLERVKARSLEAQQNQDIPFEQVVELAQPTRSLAHTPLFQVAFDWQNAPQGELTLPGLELGAMPGAERTTAKVDLSLSLWEAGGRIVGKATYATSLFERATVERYVGYLVRALGEMVADDRQRTEALRLLPDAERARVVEAWNATAAPYPLACIHDLIEAQAARTPNAVAIVFDDQRLTYAELDGRANTLARKLRSLGVGPGAYVPVLMERCAEVPVAFLGVLKAGAAFVPLHPRWPVERLRSAVGELDAAVVLTAGAAEWPPLGRPLLPVGGFGADTAGPLGVRVDTRAPMYAIYTSGSTGRPKAAVVAHRGVANRFQWMTETFGAQSAEAMLQTVMHVYDGAVLLLLWPLTIGGRVVMPRPDTESDALYLGGLIDDEGVTMTGLAPSIFNTLVPQLTGGERRLTSLRCLLLGGEQIDREATYAFMRHLPRVRINNMYGPTEATIGSIWHELTGAEQGRIPIGRPIANTRAYVLGAGLEPAPVGVPGEIYLGGVCVGLGYLKDGAKTAAAFVPDPFGEPGARLYRTGDLGRWRETTSAEVRECGSALDPGADAGTVASHDSERTSALPHSRTAVLEYLGRTDFQVKVRGFRIELGEIEARLRDHEGVREAVVLAREDAAGGDRRLVAYYVGAGGAIEVEALRAHLLERLPEYMVPAAYVHLEALPLTPNGKVDRRALPAPEDDAYARRGYEAPVGETEQALAEIWSEVLGVERVGRLDHFFEVGGHSLLVVRVISRVRQVLGAEVEIGLVFERPVLKELAEAIAAAGRADLPPIERADRSARLPLSYAQQRLWFLEQLGSLGSTYHIPGRLRLRGELDREALVRALDRLVARHEVLRTTFSVRGGEPEQRIAPETSRFHLVEHDLAGHEDALEVLERVMDEEVAAPFDLERGPLIRGQLIRLAEDDHVLLLTMHHIVSDGWSMGVLVDELSALYGAFRAGRSDPLPALPIQYADYAAWQRRWVEDRVLEAQASYWTRTLAGAPELIELPTDHPRPVRQSHAGAVAEVELDEALAAGLKALSRRHGTTLFMTALAGWAVVLGRLSGQEDVVVGTPSANRGRAEIEGLIGFFVNTLALRVDLSGSPTVAELLGRVKERALGAQHHQDIPFEQVVDLVQPVRSLAHTALFQVMFAWQNALGGRLELPGLRLGDVGGGASQVTAKFDLSLALGEADGRIVGSVEYATALFEQATVERHLVYLRRVLEAFVADDLQAVDALPLLPESERRLVVEEWNATDAAYLSDLCIHESFEAQVVRAPDAVALVHADEALTYAELNRRANRLAHHLRRLGVGPDARVAICAGRTPELVVGLLAILKAGGAYVPLDPGHPEERLRTLLADSAPALLLTQGALRARFAATRVPLVALDEDAPAWAREPEHDPARAGLTPGHLAYVIYTSGSTGAPKGVMVAHRSVGRQVAAIQAGFGLAASDRGLQFASVAFDVSVEEIFGALLSGAALVLRGDDWLEGARTFWARCEMHRLTVVDLPTRFWQLMVEDPSAAVPDCVRLLVFGGEAVEPAALEAWFLRGGHRPRLLNVYGPTETTVNATLREVTGDPATWRSIGRPVANTRAYLLDARGGPVPVGVAGELYLGGGQVARGYLDRPGVTAERFVPDPFGGGAGARLYRTGDRARRRADGELEFLGRADFQVKIRGFRIELGEIEARLGEHEGVREAVVVVREDVSGERRLVAYYAGEAREAEALRSHLSERLPEYMVPAAYVYLEAFPLTPSGKVDRKALPAPEGDAFATRGYEAPVGETERALAEIWSELLGVERVGRRDHFFELGGHSLLIVKLIERMRRRGLHAEVGTLFTTPVLAQLAEVVSGETLDVAVPANAIPPESEAITPGMLPLVTLGQADIDGIVAGVEGGAGNVQDIYPLAPLQEGILFHHLLKQEGDPYLVPSLLGFERREQLDAYLGALQAVVDRHDILRTAVVWEGLPEPVQVVWRRARLKVVEVELDATEGDAAQALWDRFDPQRTRLDVRRAPVMRCCVARDEAEGRWLLLLQDHHLISDHTTAEVLQEEVRAHLQGRQAELPAPLPFRNYVARTRLGVSRAEHEAFFRALLGDVEAPTAPFGLLDVRGDGSGIEVARQRVEPEVEARLRARARALGVSAASMCHVAWGQVLARVAGRDDVVFGTVLFGRMQGGEGADRAMGLFINTLPVRMRVGDQGAESSVRGMHRQLAELLRHEHAPLGLAQRSSGVEAPAPLFTSILNYRHNAGLAQTRLEARGGPAMLRALRTEVRTNYPVELSVDDFGEALGLSAHVPASVGAARVCALMHRALEALAEALETTPTRQIGRLDVLPEAERRLVVEAWNTTGAEAPRDTCIHELFEAQVARTPEAVAVVFGGRTLSYAELNERANRLAHHLIERGVVPDARVGICVERGPEMMVGMLGVLKAGGAYVPLDPGYPAERLRTMLADSRPAVLLTRASILAAEEGLIEGLDLQVLDFDAPAWREAPATNPERGKLSPAHLAYVIYTSGSTGQPKGVMVAHRGVVNLVHWYTREFGISGQDSVLIATSYAFDLTQRNLFGPLVTGGQLHLAREPFDPRGILAQVAERGITLANLTSTAFHALIDAGADGELASMRLVVLGGEATRPEKLMELAPPRPAFVNAYGPTECSGVVTYHRLSRDLASYVGRSVPLGEPIANSRIYILDRAGEPVPVGVVGELYVGGVQVARGYLDRPELTAERFVADPFGGEPGARLYRTGDLGRWRADGSIEFAGRNDFQVKVRGFRVELGEIEARLREHEGVREAVVVAREERPGNQRLVAYWVGEEAAAGAEALRRHVGERLPEYMVPAAYIHLDALPLTPSAKLDRRALPSPEGDAYARRAYEAPSGDTEEALAKIWSEVLGVERVGRWDHFFELGGHSLLAMQVVSRLRQALGVELPLGAVFDHPVFATLADQVLDLQLARFDPETLARLSELVHEPVAGDEAPG